MAEISDAALVEALRRHMTMAAARQVVATSNLANASTPGYRAKQADFTKALEQQLGGSARLTATQPGHFSGPADSAGVGIPTKETEGLESRRDGNNVQLDRELMAVTAAAGDFARAQTALSAKFRLLRYAISEGK